MINQNNIIKESEKYSNYLCEATIEKSLQGNNFKNFNIEKIVSEDSEFYLCNLNENSRKKYVLEIEEKNDVVNLKLVNHRGIQGRSQMFVFGKMCPYDYLVSTLGKRTQRIIDSFERRYYK